MNIKAGLHCKTPGWRKRSGSDVFKLTRGAVMQDCIAGTGPCNECKVGRGRADSLYVLAAQEPLGLEDVFLAAKVARNALVQ